MYIDFTNGVGFFSMCVRIYVHVYRDFEIFVKKCLSFSHLLKFNLTYDISTHKVPFFLSCYWVSGVSGFTAQNRECELHAWHCSISILILRVYVCFVLGLFINSNVNELKQNTHDLCISHACTAELA
jgi:hypothetical protein